MNPSSKLRQCAPRRGLMNPSGRQQQKKKKASRTVMKHADLESSVPGSFTRKEATLWCAPARKMKTRAISMPRPKDGDRTSLHTSRTQHRTSEVERPKKRRHRWWKPDGHGSLSRAVVDSRANKMADRESQASAAEK
jgi:hypothetical protein